MDLRNKTISSYSKRANHYEEKTTWVNKSECINPLTPPVFGNGNALDVCAGSGAISTSLIKKGWNVVSIDISRKMLIQNYLPIRILSDMHYLPFKNKHFDLVVCRQGLHYSDINLTLTEFSRVCKSIIRLGHITKEKNDKSEFWGKYFQIASPGRRHIFSPGDISKIAQNLGLNIFSIKILRQQDFYIGPLIQFPEETKNQLVNLLIKTTSEFKKQYNVVKNEEKEITYSNRWEFLEITL